MRFSPGRPDDSVNVSGTHPLADVSLLMAGTGALLVGATVAIVFLVDLALAVVPPGAETRLFGAFGPDSRSPAFHEDAQLADLRDLLHRLTAEWPESPYEFRIGVLDRASPNALALPGGVILVTQGLLDEVESENELAFVLGHEVGHFRNRDHLRQMGRGVALAMLAAMVTGGADTGLGQWITTAANVTFGREQEREADAFGLRLVYREYGHVAAAWDFFERLSEDGEDAPLSLPFLSTHPASRERITAIRTLARDNGWPLEGELARWPPR